MAHGADGIRIYIRVFAALLALTGLTVAAAYIDFGIFSMPVALMIATTKALLVILFFMHVRESTPLMKLVIVTGFVWFLVLVAFTFADYMTRSWIPAHSASSWVTQNASHFLQ